ncbi:MAG: IclR family transcriptional regulator [Actinomycetota bacterium]|uniref:IclR family transcriptional regulator n=1 Tax=Micrococcaceae TaxID=1268 RepID=UPI0024B989B7|nr:IclR family transcriptional regulator [Paenarthrobacter sp. PH39-S1]MDJ0354662.1 IclR family transcriptional regulator [Paenarthrobacter sp. PH39-S1]MDQ6740092.1 IclR family transcriptional regulator [Actinomycetota bacterium]
MAGRPRQSDELPQGAAASLLNGLGVLEAFSIEKPVLGVTEIAQKVNLHKSTVSRILTGLATAGYVERDEETGRFRLGLGLIGLSGPLLAELDVRRAAHAELERLTELTGETSALAVWNGTEAVVVEQIPSPHQVKHTAPIGTRYNLYESSSVRTFLAELPFATAQGMLDQGLITHSLESGLGSDYLQHLTEVKKQGYAVNDGYTTFEEVGISAVVRDYRGVVVGCITTSAPRSRTGQERISLLAGLVLAAARTVSTRLGGRLAG